MRRLYLILDFRFLPKIFPFALPFDVKDAALQVLVNVAKHIRHDLNWDNETRIESLRTLAQLEIKIL